MMLTSIENKVRNEGSEGYDISRVVGEILDGWKLILSVCSIFLILSICYVLFSTPVYKASAILQIEQNQGNAILNSLNQILPDSQPLTGPEISIIQSNMIASRVVSDLNLQTSIEPDYFPIFGRGWDRLFGVKRGSIEISDLFIEGTTTKNPQKLILTVIDNDHYKIEFNDKEINGVVGNALITDGVTIKVDKISANVGAKFVVKYLTKLRAANDLLNNLDVADQGKDSGILRVTFTGTDQNKIESILNKINESYVNQNVERQAAQDTKSLEFLKNQLPEVRNELDVAEDKLNEYRKKKDSVDLSLEAKSALDQLVNIDNQLNELTFKEAEISQLYTKEHPTYKSLLEKRTTLQQEEDALNKKISSMPATQQGVLKLSRDVESGRAVYMQLLSRQQELNIAKNSAIGNVRIIDSAIVSVDPVKPNKILVVLMGLVIGLFLSIGLIILRNALRIGLVSPQQLEDEGINVYASIPESTWLKRNLKNKSKGGHNSGDKNHALLAIDNPADMSVEAIRSLRTSLHFVMAESTNNILMISGSTENAGKTFVSANLAVLAAQAGKKVLIVDADMRKGTAHNLLGVEIKTGLSDILSGEKKLESVINRLDSYNLDFITRGKIPTNPSELLMSDRMREFIEEIKSKYTLIIIDTPPVLSITDAEIVGAYCGANMHVVRYEVNTLKEILLSRSKFQKSGSFLTGCILNGITRRSSRYGYSYGYYGHNYSEVPD